MKCTMLMVIEGLKGETFNKTKLLSRDEKLYLKGSSVFCYKKIKH